MGPFFILIEQDGMPSRTLAFSPICREKEGAHRLGFERTRSLGRRHVNENVVIRQGHLCGAHRGKRFVEPLRVEARGSVVVALFNRTSFEVGNLGGWLVYRLHRRETRRHSIP